MITGASTIRVRGPRLRSLRRKEYPSADSFAAACDSVSAPTVYRAERGGRVRKEYLERMARVLGVDLAEIAADAPPRGDGRASLTGEWFGLYVCSDQYGRSRILTENVRLEQSGHKVSGVSGHDECDRERCDVFVDCDVVKNVFTGRMTSVDWPYPFDAPAFVLSGARDMSFLAGYLTWFDMDAQRPEFSRYFLMRKDRESFEEDVAAVRGTLEGEIKLLALRRALDAGVEFEAATRLVTEGRFVDQASAADA